MPTTIWKQTACHNMIGEMPRSAGLHRQMRGDPI
jgi:hypothetical protein